MNLIDMKTVFFIIIVVTSMCALFLTISWKQNRSRYAGINFWVGDFLFQVLGEVLVSLRGFIPDILSILISNIFIIFGSILGYVGIEHYLCKVRNLEVKFLKKTGIMITGIMSSDIININGEKVILSIVNDITERKAMEEKIVEMSNRDPLTNVYNRRYIFSRLECMLEEYKSDSNGFSITIIDIDHFKKVNDEYGHQGGDVVLIELTETINKMIGNDGFLGRYGGEEFIIISFKLDKEKTSKIIENILQVIRNSAVIYESREIRYTLSGGISDTFEFPKESLDIEIIINQADTRLYEAKRNGRNQIKC